MKRKQTRKGLKNQRKSPRFKTRKLVRAEYGGSQSSLGDLSLTGAFIRTAKPLQAGKELKLRLVGEHLEEPINLSAVIRRREQGHGMAVEFTQFRNQDQRRLESVLASLSVARILVVDDDKNIRRMLQFALEHENYEVVTAADGREGLQKALDSKPDLIILDLGLPELSGLEVCQRVRARPELTKVPIIILSATTDLTEVSAVLKLGSAMFAPKPFQAQRLLNYVRMLLEH